jgi:hypothetical protein
MLPEQRSRKQSSKRSSGHVGTRIRTTVHGGALCSGLGGTVPGLPYTSSFLPRLRRVRHHSNAQWYRVTLRAGLGRVVRGQSAVDIDVLIKMVCVCVCVCVCE